MKLDLPGRVPLPDDVRHRVLDSVLAGLDETPARRWPARELLAAAVAAVLVVGVSVATTLLMNGGADRTLLLPAASPPAEIEGLDRCRAAAPAGAGLPPVAGWSVTREHDLGVDRVLVIDDRFACLLSPRSVTLSPPEGAPVGGASVVRLAPAVVAVLNPDELPVSVSGDASPLDEGDRRVIVVTTDGLLGEDYRIVVGDTYDGPPPADLPAGEPVVDRPLPSRGYDEADGAAMDLEACLTRAEPSGNSEPELWTPAFIIGDPEPPVLVARIADRFAGFCVLAPDGPRFAIGGIGPDARIDGQIVATSVPSASPGEPSDGGVVRILVAVPEGTHRVEITGVPTEGGRIGSVCEKEGDLALCQLLLGPDPAPEVAVFHGPPGSARVLHP